MIFNVCKFILLSRPTVFAVCYPCLVVALTAVVYVLRVPALPFPNLEVVTDILAEYTWFYVAAFLAAFLIITHWTLAGGKVRLMPVLRVAISLCVAVVVRAALVVLADYLGDCSRAELKSRAHCLQLGFAWTPLPRIPAVCFLSFYGLLVILEEAAIYRQWDEVEHMIQHCSEYSRPDVHCEPDICDNPRGFEDVETLVNMHVRITVLVKILFSCLTILAVLLHVDNLVAVLCYKSAALKIAATLMPLPVWLVTYRIAFRIDACRFWVEVDRTRIEEYFIFTEQTTEKDNLIEEIEYRNDVKTSKSFFLGLWSRFCRKAEYDEL